MSNSLIREESFFHIIVAIRPLNKLLFVANVLEPALETSTIMPADKHGCIWFRQPVSPARVDEVVFGPRLLTARRGNSLSQCAL